MRFLNKKSVSRGFSLVELLVVISIIASLSAIVYANFGKARASARDSIRIASLKDMELALKLYKAQNGSYPIGCNGSGSNRWSGLQTSSGPCPTAGDNNYIPNLTAGFISSLPSDKSLVYTSDGANFKLVFYNSMEVKTVAYGDEYYRCPSSVADASCPGTSTLKSKSTAVYSLGAAAW